MAKAAYPEWMVRLLGAVHGTALRLSGGRIGRFVLGMEAVELHTTGRRTGRERAVLLTAPIQQDGRIVLVASLGGGDHHPAWYLNLRANPDVRITGAAGTRRYRARTATGDERAALWSRAVEVYPNYAHYQECTDRVIPVVVCEPVD